MDILCKKETRFLKESLSMTITTLSLKNTKKTRADIGKDKRIPIYYN